MPTRLWSSELPYVLVVALVLTALLLRTRPADRSSILNTLWLFVLGVAGQAAGFGAAKLGFDPAARILELLFRVVWTIALIRLAGLALFRYVLPRLGRSLPRIIEDLALVAIYVAYARPPRQ